MYGKMLSPYFSLCDRNRPRGLTENRCAFYSRAAGRLHFVLGLLQNPGVVGCTLK